MPSPRLVSAGGLWRGPQGFTTGRDITPPPPPPQPAAFDPTTYDFTQSGAPAGSTLTTFAQQDIAGGTIYSARDVPYNAVDWYMDVSGMDTGFTGSVIRQSLRVGNTGARLYAEHCDLFPTRANAVSGRCSIRHCHVKGEPNDGLALSTAYNAAPSSIPVLVEYNLIEKVNPWVGSTHHDGIQIWHGSNVTIRRNLIRGNFHTSCIIIKADWGVIDGVLVEENWFDSTGSFYHTYSRIGKAEFGKPRNLTFLNNAFGPGAVPISVETSQVFVRTEAERTNPEWIVWNGNRRVDAAGVTTAENIAPPNGWS